MPRFDRKDVIPVILAGIIVIGLLYAAYKLIVDEPIFGTPAAAAAFDHSECQYPNRLSNPPDGCDNSDPARPECMKIGIEDCDIPVKDVSEPIIQPTTPYASPEAVKTSNCKE